MRDFRIIFFIIQIHTEAKNVQEFVSVYRNSIDNEAKG